MKSCRNDDSLIFSHNAPLPYQNPQLVSNIIELVQFIYATSPYLTDSSILTQILIVPNQFSVSL